MVILSKAEKDLSAAVSVTEIVKIKINYFKVCTNSLALL